MSDTEIINRLDRLIQLQREQRIFIKYIYGACAQTAIATASLMGLSDTENMDLMEAAKSIVEKTRELTNNMGEEIREVQVEIIAGDPLWKEME